MDVSNTYEQLIARYLNGDFSQEDERELMAWIDENPENKKLFLEMKDIWDTSRKVEDRTEEKLIEFYQQQSSKSSQRKLKLWHQVVAAAAILVLGLFIGNVLTPTSDIEDQLAVYSVPLGSKSNIVLVDGTKISLNSGSELKVAKGFGKRKRMVSLKGEAYFEVVSDKRNPFFVKTADFDVKVTGTKFNVCSYKNDDSSSTTLMEGKVELKTKNEDFYKMIPGNKVIASKSTGKSHVINVDAATEAAWKDGTLVFKEVALSEMVRRLERWYDVKINYSSKLFEEQLYSARFKNQETIWQVLDALKLTTQIEYEKTGFREYTLKYKNE